MKRLFLSFLCIASAVAALAQSGTKVVGRVMDSDTGESMLRATVQLMKTDSTSMVAGAVTNSLGYYELKNIQEGNYVIKISYIGYRNFFHRIEVAGKQKEMNAGTAILAPSSEVLQAATVTGTLRQMEVKEDTLIFNADAFKTPEGSVLEELLRKIPGIEISDDGGVKFNGRTVSKILVGGKEFFGNDKSMAMKNLPTEIVEKVKAYDRQSDNARMTGIDDGEEETVIDLTIKKGMQGGWFGNLDLAGGTEGRFAERGMLNRFSEGTQMSVVGSYNNVNDQGFQGFGGRTRGGSGLVTSGMGGANMALVRGDWEIGGNIRYSGRNSDSWTRSASQNFVTTNTSFSNSFNQSTSKNHSVSADFRIEWKIDSMTTMNFRPNFTIGSSRSWGNGESATFNSDPYADERISDPLSQLDAVEDGIKVNHNMSDSYSDADNYRLGGSLILNRKLNTVGRNVSLRMNGSVSGNENKNYALSDVRYFQFGDSTDLTYRYRTTPNDSRNFTAGFNYTEPLIAKRLFLQTEYRYNYSKRHSDGKAYDMGDIDYLVDSIRSTGAGFLPWNYAEFLDSDLSRYTDNENYTHNINVQLRLVTSSINMNAGVSMEPQRQKVKYQYMGLDTVATRNFFRISPSLNFRYRFSKQHTLRVRYRGNTQQPEITSMFNMTDNSNPLNIRLGNPNLKPSFTNNLSADWNNYVTTTMQNFNARFEFSTTQNSISNRTEYNEETGGRITRPENINGNWNVSGNFGFVTPVVLENISLNTTASVRHNNNVGYIYQNYETLKNSVRSTTLGERLSLMLRRDLFDAGVNGNISYNRTRSSLVPTNNRDTYDFSYGAFCNLNLDNGLSFSTNISMSSRRGYSAASMNTNELIWNAQASYRFLAKKQATLSLQAYDILANRSNISRTISATMRSDSENNSINSYVMAHFIYRFNVFGSSEARRDMRRGRDGGFERGSFGGGAF